MSKLQVRPVRSVTFAMCIFDESLAIICYRFCFFFQAEDGIRDVAVTGVQTCALPISWNFRRRIRNHHYCSIFSRNDGQQSVSVRCTTLSANDLIARLITDPPSESVLESVSAVRIGLGLMHLVDVSTRQNGMRFQIIFEVKHPE